MHWQGAPVGIAACLRQSQQSLLQSQNQPDWGMQSTIYSQDRDTDGGIRGTDLTKKSFKNGAGAESVIAVVENPGAQETEKQKVLRVAKERHEVKMEEQCKSPDLLDSELSFRESNSQLEETCCKTCCIKSFNCECGETLNQHIEPNSFFDNHRILHKIGVAILRFLGFCNGVSCILMGIVAAFQVELGDHFEQDNKEFFGVRVEFKLFCMCTRGLYVTLCCVVICSISCWP